MIVLVNIASEFRGVEAYKRPPSGLLYIGGSLMKSGYPVKIFHIVSADIKKTAEAITAIKPLFVGLSLFTGLVAKRTAEFSKELRMLDPNIPIVWGGVHPSLVPEQCLEQPYVDYVCIGEGEETIVELANALKRSTPVDKIRGIGFKRNGKVHISAPRPLIEKLDSYHMDWTLLNLNDYVQWIKGIGGLFPYITSRGCPFSCGFCYNYSFNRQRWRAHSVNHVIDHVIRIKEDTGANWVFFDDDNFFADAKRALTILHLLYDNGIRCSFLELRVDSITMDIMEELRSLEVKRVFVGWESGSDRILKLVSKGFNKSAILEKCRILAAFPEIAVDASAIIGFPTETKEDIYETIDLALEMADLIPNINFNLGTYLPYPGTKLYELVLKEGFTPPNDPDGWGTFDILAGNIKLQWLPWASDNEHEILRRIDRYGKLLNRAEYSNPLVNFVNRAIYQTARFRLRKKIFCFPLEIIGQEWWLKRTTRKLQSKD